MKFPFAMLLDFVVTDLDAEAVGDLLTMAGFELEGIEEVEGDKVLDIKVCSNRGDGLSVLGLAREVLAKMPGASSTELYENAIRHFAQPDDSGPSGLGVTVKIETAACSRFAYRGFSGVVNGEAPAIVRKRLRQTGQRSISLFVDLTNYVMLELGQPLHAYDLDKLQGKEIVVREARDGERLTTLDGIERVLRSDQMMICDSRGPIGVAGVMGGSDTEVDAGTKRVLLEAAHFENTSVRRTRKQLGLNTDASYRFERSVDPEGVVGGLNRVRQLLDDLGHGEWAVNGVSDVYPGRPRAREVRLRMAKADVLLGMPVTEDEAKRYLGSLGFGVEGGNGELVVMPPSWRPDVTREEDLIEELGRVHGYERIPEVLPQGTSVRGGVQGAFLAEEILIDGGVRLGFDQVMTHSLRGEGPLDAPDPKIPIRTPGSPDTAYLRNSLLPGLAEALRKNGGAGIHLFELGPVFEEPRQTRKAMALISSGNLQPENRRHESGVQADFFSMKAALEALAALLGVRLNHAASANDRRFHPTRQAKVSGDGWTGVIGQIHPLVAEEVGVPKETVLSEVFPDLNRERPEQHFHPVSRTPSIRRDLAFAIDKAVPFANVDAAVRKALGPTLEDLWLFDVYEGKGIGEGMHSLAIALTLRKADGTFTDEEANQVRETAVAALVELGATPR